MSRSKPNLGEPYQIYTEVMNVGKNVEGSKRKIRWLFGFTEKEGEVEVALIHSVTSGKKTIFEDGKEIVSSTNRLATDFGHTWRSETCQGRLFRVEFATSFTTDPTIYTFTVDGIKFIDMPKKGTIGGGGGGGASFANKNRSINGFGTGAGSAVDSAPSHSHSQSHTQHHSQASRAPSGTTSGFGQQSRAAEQPAPVASSSRRFVYDDDEEDTATSTAPKAQAHSTPAAAPRANFQSPFAPTNTATNAGFGFDPFDESPAPAPAAKPTATASLFDAFDEPAPQPKTQAQPAAKKASGGFDAFGSDPFANSSDPFASPAPAPAPQRTQAHAQPAKAAAPVNKASPAAAGGAAPAKSVPNFMDDDFAAPVAPPAAQANNDFGNFGTTHTTPQRRSSAIEISNDFAGLTFAAPAPVQQTPPPAPVAAPVAAPAPTPEPVSNDPWSQSNLVNLDLSGNNKPVKRPSATAAGPSLSSMMHAAPTNSRASFTAGSPSAIAPAGGMSGGMQPMQPMGGGQNTRGSFIAAPQQGGLLQPNHPQQGVYGQQQQQPMGMGLGAQQPMSMGGNPQMGMGMNNNMNNAAPRASFNAGPMAMGGAPNGNMGAMGGGMQNTRGSFIAANPTPGMGYGAPGQGLQPAQPPKSSLDTLDWNF